MRPNYCWICCFYGTLTGTIVLPCFVWDHMYLWCVSVYVRYFNDGTVSVVPRLLKDSPFTNGKFCVTVVCKVFSFTLRCPVGLCNFLRTFVITHYPRVFKRPVSDVETTMDLLIHVR